LKTWAWTLCSVIESAPRASRSSISGLLRPQVRSPEEAAAKMPLASGKNLPAAALLCAERGLLLRQRQGERRGFEKFGSCDLSHIMVVDFGFH
jgi:hypothetical protein